MLSNKLTFSLSFIVMLAVGLALMATTADAAKYSATWNKSMWDITIIIPVSTDNPLAATGVNPETPAIAVEATERDGLSGVTLSVATSSSSISPAALQADLTTAATNRADVAAHSYAFSVPPPTDNNLVDEIDDTAITMSLTDSDYSVVTIGFADRADGIKLTDFVAPVIGENTFEFSIDTSVSNFAIIAKSDTATTDDPNLLMNGIRTGENYVDATTITEETSLPDLDSFFQHGGSIKILDGGNDPAVAIGEVHITEIQWGHDGTNLTGAPTAAHQWIEVHYQGDAGSVDLQIQFVYAAHDPGGIDEISNLYLAKWNPKGQRGHSEYGQFNGAPPVDIISMYRKRGLLLANTGGSDYDPNAKFAANGAYPDSWDASAASLNMTGAFVGTPGSAHILPRVGGGHADYAKNEIPGSPLQISEVRNDPSVDDVDWIELRNTSDAPVNLKDYEISGVTGVSRRNLHGVNNADLIASKKEDAEHEKAIVGYDDYDRNGINDVKRFPDWKLPAGAYLVIVNRDPEETILASGKNIEVLANANIDNKTTNKGAGFYYFVTSHLNGRLDTAGLLLVLRSRVDRNEFDGKVHGDGASIIDLAGSGRHSDASAVFNTEVWPLKGWKNPGGSPDLSGAGVWNFVEGGNHEWWKTGGVANNGVGYDKNTNPKLAVGSPGYPNGVVKDKLTDHKGTPSTTDDTALLMGNISFSEIMFDASVHAGNERWNLVQWIELYNSSMTEAINLMGWELEIRNSDDHVDSFVDSSFIFGDLIVHPNQTVLLVSARAASSGVADRQVYNLYEKHSRELGLANRRANLLSPAGFFLRLSYKANDGLNSKIVVDEVGNVSVNGRQRSTADWEAIPPSEGPVRYSLVRQYGTRAEDGNGPDLPAVGTMEEAWIVADLDGEGATYFGQRGDVATPGFRTGGPLPVSLSSFNPKRNDAGSVVITWITASELNNAGFNILRSQQKNGEFKIINPKLIAGAGTTSEKNVYTFTDTTAKPNVIYYYQIEDVSFDGQRQTLTTRRLRGHVSAGGKLTTTWSSLKQVK